MTTINETMEPVMDDTMHPISQEDVENGHVAAQEATMSVCAVAEEGNQIAFANYDESTNIITIEKSHTNGSDTQELIERFYTTAKPNMILMSNKTAANTGLLNALTKPPPPPIAYEDEEHAHPQPPPQAPQQDPFHSTSSIPYRILKSAAFDVKKGTDLVLQSLRVLDLLKKNQVAPVQQQAVPIGHFQPSSYHSIASVVDFDSTILIRAIGALLSFLQSTIFRLEEGSTVTVASIVQAKSSMFMRISASTLRALHIFATEHHPLMVKGQGHSKEGFSLFSLLDRTKSKMGRQCLRDWMLKPLVDMETILERQDGVEMFLCNEFQASTGTLLSNLEKVGAVDRIILRMSKCQTSGMDFIVLVRSLTAALAVCSTLEHDFMAKLMNIATQHEEAKNETAAIRYKNYYVFCHNILSRCSLANLRDVQSRITAIVDEEATIEEKESVVIKLGFHEELDVAKERYASMDRILAQAGDEVISDYPSLRNVNVVFLQQLGFLVAVSKSDHTDFNEETNTFSGLPQEFMWVFSNRADQAFYKCARMRMLDEEVSDPLGYIQDTEKLIVSSLEDDILDHEPELRATFTALAELDCILCFAACADDLKFSRPTMAEPRDRCVNIKNGRHPLQEIIVDTEYVPNDTSIDSRNRIAVITGPNFSGKSCYTRQVGVIVYMAHLGCFVPAESANIAITDQILARISAVETCSVPQSTFQHEMTQMGTILRTARPYSLILVDEFGKGTSPSSGISVLTAALKKLSKIKAKVVFTTHYLEVFSLNLIRDGIEGIKASQMAVQIPQTKDGLARPLFQLRPGFANSSAGLVCAEKAGLNRRVVARAREILEALKDGEQVEPIAEIFQPKLNLTKDAHAAVQLFLAEPNWQEASMDTLQALLKHICRM